MLTKTRQGKHITLHYTVLNSLHWLPVSFLIDFLIDKDTPSGALAQSCACAGVAFNFHAPIGWNSLWMRPEDLRGAVFILKHKPNAYLVC